MRSLHLTLSLWLLAAMLALGGCVRTWETRDPQYAASASGPGSLAPEAQQTLAPTGVLRVGVYLGSPTSWVQDARTGASHGVAFELGHALGQALGVPVQIVRYPRVAEVIEALKRAEVDMTFTNATPARAKDVDFTPPLIQLELGVLVPSGSAIQSFAQIDRAGVRLGVSQGSSSQGVLGQRLKLARLVPVASLDVAQQQLQRGELDDFATNKGILFELSEKVPGSQVLTDRWGLENLAIAIPKGREAGRAYLNDFAQARVREGDVQRMSERAGLRGLAQTP